MGLGHGELKAEKAALGAAAAALMRVIILRDAAAVKDSRVRQRQGVS